MLEKEEFETIAKHHWTIEKLNKVLNGKKYFITPANSAYLLRVLGILNSDASMSPNNMSKFIQINHMFQLIEPQVAELKGRHKSLNIVDAGCGKSYLTFLLAWYFNLHSDAKKGDIIGVDSNKKLVQDCLAKAKLLSFDHFLHFQNQSLLNLNWEEMSAGLVDVTLSKTPPRPHVVVALHACDTATDMALSFAVKNKADFIAVAPCCQAELARKWKEGGDKNHAFNPIYTTPQIRREVAAHLTDTLRVCLMRAHGYEVTCTEFVESSHTPKNRLITCVRRGNYNTQAQEEYKKLKEHLGGESIMLEGLLATEMLSGTD